MMDEAITEQSRVQECFKAIFAGTLLRSRCQPSKDHGLQLTRRAFGCTWNIPCIARGFQHGNQVSEQKFIQRLPFWVGLGVQISEIWVFFIKPILPIKSIKISFNVNVMTIQKVRYVLILPLHINHQRWQHGRYPTLAKVRYANLLCKLPSD